MAYSYERKLCSTENKWATATQNFMDKSSPGIILQIFNNWYDIGFEQMGNMPDINDSYRSAGRISMSTG